MAEGTQVLSDAVLYDKHFAGGAVIARAKLAARTTKVVTVPLTKFRVWDAMATNLPGTSATDDLALTNGTWASAPPYIGTSDLKAAGATTRRAGVLIALPHDYEPSEELTLRLHAGMITTVAGTSATIDVEAYRIGKEDGTIGSTDLVTTSATTINSLTEAAKDFTITASGLGPGDVLFVRVTIVVTDADTVTVVIGAFYQCELIADLW